MQLNGLDRLVINLLQTPDDINKNNKLNSSLLKDSSWMGKRDTVNKKQIKRS